MQRDLTPTVTWSLPGNALGPPFQNALILEQSLLATQSVSKFILAPTLLVHMLTCRKFGKSQLLDGANIAGSAHLLPARQYNFYVRHEYLTRLTKTFLRLVKMS